MGCFVASAHLIDTGEGLILIDSGSPQNLYQVIHNVYKLCFDIMDIRYIIHSHGHYDHLGGTKALRKQNTYNVDGSFITIGYVMRKADGLIGCLLF